MKGALHLVGFKGAEYLSALKTFGSPDFVHRFWDARAKAEVFVGDTVVFANQEENKTRPYTYDDSSFF